VIIPVIIIPILLSSSSAIIIIIIINHLVTTYHQNETKSIGPGTTVYRLWNPQSNLFCSLTTSYDTATIQFPFFCALFICIISSINDPPLQPVVKDDTWCFQAQNLIVEDFQIMMLAALACWH
jgi:hypothetical protein